MVEDTQEIKDSQQSLTSKRPQVLRSVLIFGSECSVPFRVLFVFSLWERQEGTPKTQALVKRPFTHTAPAPMLRPHPARADWPWLLLRMKVQSLLPLSSRLLFLNTPTCVTSSHGFFYAPLGKCTSKSSLHSVL